ncbi:acyl-CoA dehydrogenase family protein [Burkholderia sp. 22PA0106]|uniref:acyl-CoA dehydrogenase family protein n=1 Tax=Burkholderia sp. 22PA0106 TaxID=3237371 RepID=UPI0039C4DF85
MTHTSQEQANGQHRARAAVRRPPGVPPTPRHTVADPASLDALLATLPASLDDTALAAAAHRLIEAFPHLPRPGAGNTLARWRFLAGVAGRDLPLVKLVEAHADADAILAELGGPMPAGREPGLLAVWAARSPAGDLRISTRSTRSGSAGSARLDGTKAWCSGAHCVDTALVTCIDADGHDRLAIVAMRQPGVTISARGWDALGMRATRSVEVDFVDAAATLVGPPGAYVQRPGFWHGGAGIAACWYGGAAALATRLRDAAGKRDDPHLHAHLGTADIALTAARALLRETAQAIDAEPRADAMAAALRARGAAEHAADTVLRAAQRGLGAGPLCRDRWFAQMAADLPVFLRQSHAERDLAALGAALATSRPGWRL